MKHAWGVSMRLVDTVVEPYESYLGLMVIHYNNYILKKGYQVLLGSPFGIQKKDRLYRNLKLLLAHAVKRRDGHFQHVQARFTRGKVL